MQTDPAGNIKPDKAKSTEKIDGVVALTMALDRCIRNEGTSRNPVYDERGADPLIVFSNPLEKISVLVYCIINQSVKLTKGLS